MSLSLLDLKTWMIWKILGLGLVCAWMESVLECTGKSRFKEFFQKFDLNITWFHLLTMTKSDSYFNEFPAKCVIHIFFARFFFTYLGNILLKTIHMKTWTLIWITSYSKMMVRDIFHFRKVQASTMGLNFLWMSILKCIHLHFITIFFSLQRCENAGLKLHPWSFSVTRLILLQASEFSCE